MNKEFIDMLNQVRDICHQQAKENGWWDKPPEIGTLLALIHSEVSEALKGALKDAQDEHLPHRKSLEVELGDVIMRVMDTAGRYNLDIGGAIAEKLEYNKTRKDHKLESRKQGDAK